MADDQQISQNEIEDLFKAQAPAAPKKDPPADASGTSLGKQEIDDLIAGGAKPVPAGGIPVGMPQSPPAMQRAATSSTRSGDDIQVLFDHAMDAVESIEHPVESSIPDLAPFELRDLGGTRPTPEQTTLELLRDVELDLRIELGRTHMHLEDVLQLGEGSVVPLDKLAGDPVDIFANGRLIARGEVLVLNENFCVRVAELMTGDETS